MDQFSVDVISEVVTDNKEVFGGVEINRRLFKKFLEDIEVPDNINIKIIDVGIACKKYFEVAERLAEDYNNKIILTNASSIVFVKPVVGERSFYDLLAKNNVIFLTNPMSFKEVKQIVEAFIEFHELKKV